MPSYETIPTIRLAKNNELIAHGENLPELVHLDDKAKSVFIDFSKFTAATISPKAAIDIAIHEMKIHHQQLLLVEEHKKIIGIVSFEDVISEKPLRIMHEKKLNRSEITVEMLMNSRDQVLAIDTICLKYARVGHIINTIRKHATRYLLVVKKSGNNKHIIKGLFSASQIGKQLHIDLTSLLTAAPETIIDLHKERKS